MTTDDEMVSLGSRRTAIQKGYWGLVPNRDVSSTQHPRARTFCTLRSAEAQGTISLTLVSSARQLLRVPKAGSSGASVIARRLGGCMPPGPCCRFPGDPPRSCPAHGLMCPRVRRVCMLAVRTFGVVVAVVVATIAVAAISPSSLSSFSPWLCLSLYSASSPSLAHALPRSAPSVFAGTRVHWPQHGL